MKRLNAVVRIAFLLVTMFAMVFLSQAQSGGHLATKQQKKSAAHEIHIVDQSGRPAVSGVPSGTGQIVDVQVGPGFAFAPDTVNISAGDTVRWTWAAATVSPADLLALSIRSFVPLMIRTAPREFFRTRAQFIRTLSQTPASILTSATRIALRA